MHCQERYHAKTIIAALVLAAVFLFMAHQEAACLSDPPEVYLYKIAGKNLSGEYQGEAGIIIGMDKPGSITAYRQIGKSRMNGEGTLQNGKLQLRFKNPALKPGEKVDRKIVPDFLTLNGQFDSNLKTGRVIFRSFEKSRIRSPEVWKLVKRAPLYEKQTKNAVIKGKAWNQIPLSVTKPGVIKIISAKNRIPRGFILPKGTKIPEISPAELPDFLPPLDVRKGKNDGLPDIHNEDGDAWLKEFNEKDLEKEWAFYFRDDGIRDSLKKAFEIFHIDHWFPFCNPWVHITVSPHEAAAGEPISITVSARAFAGLDMFWWYGQGTSLPGFDKAHIISGGGLMTGSHTWTVTIGQPGTYTFGANARDVLYWTQHGVPHQASEGCGLDYDTITVTSSHKSYSAAFVLLAPQGTDTAGSNFQAQLNKLEDIKQALISQFETSTEGRGTVDVSYPTVVLTPPGPVYGLSDGDSLMYTFVRQAISNYFYPSNPDQFDFIAVYEAYPDKTIGSRHYTVKTMVAGFGITPYNASASWGSAGRLTGIGLVDDITELPDTYEFMASQMHLLLHEVFGHQWGVFAPGIMKPGFHFGLGIESPNFTVLYGRPWRKIDETHFTTTNIQDPATGTFLVTFHPWMLYVAGMKLRPEVPEVLMDVAPDTPPASRYDLVTTTGTYSNITLQNIIDQSGDRYDVEW